MDVLILTGVLFGMAPALHAVQTDLGGSLKEGGRGTTASRRGRQVRNALVIAEVALAFVLLSEAAAFRSPSLAGFG